MNKRRSVLALDWLNFFMADVETGIGPFVSTYLSAAHHWNPAQIGLVLGAQSMAEVIAQTPAGWLIDHLRFRKWLIAAAAVIIAVGALFIVILPDVGHQMVNQIAIGIAAAFVSPTVAAISLGLVGRAAFSQRVGRNAAFSHGGNVTTAVLAGYLGYAAGQQWIFYTSAALGIAVIASLLFIRDSDIDNNAARESPANGSEASSLPEILKNRRLILFVLIVVVFHLSNAAMLPLAGQELAKGTPGASSLYMSACIVTAQFVMAPVAWLVGRLANRTGRKPIFLAAFLVLAVRGLLFALDHRPFYIVGVQVLDGVGTAIASVLAVLVISDLAKGTGRFNFMLGLTQAAVGIGAFVGNSAGGFIAKTAGFPAAFTVLASIAVAGFLLYATSMPETREQP